MRVPTLVTMMSLVLISTPMSAQEIGLPTNRLQSPVDTVRVRTFYGLVADAARGQGRRSDGSLRPRIDLLAERARAQPDLAAAVIRLLEYENQLVKSPPSASSSETDMIDYRLDLVTVVAKIRDPRTVGLLLPWLQNGGEAQSAIISFGEVAVPELIRLLDDTNQHQRWGAARTLGMIANSSRNQLNSSSFEAIKVALLQTLRHEEDWLLRLSAVNALAAYSTDDVRNEMERLSRGDTASVGDGDRRKYPVRDAARAWLSTHPK